MRLHRGQRTWAEDRRLFSEEVLDTLESRSGADPVLSTSQ